MSVNGELRRLDAGSLVRHGPSVPLTLDQSKEVKAICDQVCETLETSEVYEYNLDERRGKAGCFSDDVWDEALLMLGAVGYDAMRLGPMVRVRRNG